MKPEQASLFFDTLCSQSSRSKLLFSVWREQGDQKRPIDRYKTFSDATQWLEATNGDGFGTFFVVNETEGGGKWDDIVGVRAFFIDVDSKLGTAEIPEEAIRLLHPTMIIQSGNGQHAYWVLKQDRDPSELLAHFESVQEALRVKFRSDPQVKNRNRKMRIPGFYHHKGAPFLVEMIHCDPTKIYSLEEIVEGLQLNVGGVASRVVTAGTKDFSSAPRIPGIERPLSESDLETLENKISAIEPGVRAQRARKELLKKLEGASIAPKRGEAHKQLVEASFLGHDYGACRYDPSDSSVREDDLYWPAFAEVVEKHWDSSLSGEPFSLPYIEREYVSIVKSARAPWGSAWIERKAWEDYAKIKIEMDSPEVALSVYRMDEVIPPHELVRAEVQPRSDEPRTPDAIALCVARDYKFMNQGRDFILFYNGKYWESVSKDLLKKACKQYTSYDQKSVTTVISNAASMAAWSSRFTDGVDWNRIKEYEIPFDNGVLDLRDMSMRDHCHEDFLDRVIPHKYEPGSKCPNWLRVLEEWLPGEEDRIALQAFFGYILMPKAQYKKALMIYGPPHTGKSICSSIAVEMCGGPGYICSVKPSDMGDPRKVAPIKGKALNLVADLSSDEIVSDGGFKQMVSTGDTINIDEKFKPAMAYVPTAKHLFATNNLPHVNDASKAVFERLLILPFNNEVPKDRRDPSLEKALRAEILGIICWALEGARNLLKSNGRWPDNLSSEKIIEQMEQDSNPILEFLTESDLVVKAPDMKGEDFIDRSKFCALFRAWHVKNGGRRWSNRAIVSRLRAQNVDVDYKYNGVRKVGGWCLSDEGRVQLSLNL